MARPLSDLPVVLGRMAKAAGTIEKTSVRPITQVIRLEAEIQGSRYALKSKGAQTKVPLGAKSNVKTFGTKPVGQVEGVPAGFWRIVEEGSSKHLIVGRYRRQIGLGPRLGSGGFSKTGRSLSRSAKRSERMFLRGDEFDTNAIRVGPKAYRQWAVHPGHGSIGRPWRNTMRAADGIVSRELTQVASKQFTAAWK